MPDPAPTPAEPDPVERPPISFAWQGEDGDRYWAEGHLTDEAMLLAVACSDLFCNGGDEAAETLFGEGLRGARCRGEGELMDRVSRLRDQVRRCWMRPDPDNDENMLPCNEAHPAATAWTEFTL